MITIIYSTHKDTEYNNKFKSHLLQTSGLKDIQILEYQNNNEYSLSEIYNRGISESVNDIIVCCHNDIKLEKNWGKKLIDDFSNNPDFGIIGKAGSCYFPESGVYWEKMRQTMVGQVYHHPKDSKKWLSKYSPKLPFIIPVVTIDGLFISFNKTKIKHKFDESFGKFHFYDHGFSIPNYLDGVKIGVTSSFEITHESVGKPNEEFYNSKEKFLEKWSGNLPLDLKPENVFAPTITEKPIKNIGKVAVIIPTKGKVEMLFDCVDSLYKHCNSNLFDVFIADTGSSESEKKWIKDEILKLGNVKLIEYDYYNFAKINNDVVLNYINDDYEYLLFCNNDIKILNNVIYGMLKTFKENHRCGTVGARLHFSDNTIQHDGVFMGVHNSNGNMGVGHHNIYNYYNYNIDTKESFGNTGALLMIRKNVFINSGMFNENYISCFEDVELNVQTQLKGFKNFTCSNCVAYHYESQTRNEDNEKINKLNIDYTRNLLPLFLKNADKLKDKLVPLA
jgi:GT2 family glycosyltransferase